MASLSTSKDFCGARIGIAFAIVMGLGVCLSPSSGAPTLVQSWGSPGHGNGQFDAPSAIAVDGAGNVYVTDQGTSRVQKFAGDGTFITAWDSHSIIASNPYQYFYPIGADPTGNIYVADFLQHTINKFTSDGTPITSWTTGGIPAGIAFDATANAYVTSFYGPRIFKYTGNGSLLSTLATSAFVGSPTGIAVDNGGYIYAADSGDLTWCGIRKFNSAGDLVTYWGSRGSGDGQFNTNDGSFNIEGVALDGLGDVYVADTYNHRVEEFTNTGQFITALGGLNGPTGIAIDNMGDIFVADQWNNRVYKYFDSSIVPEPTLGMLVFPLLMLRRSRR